jgi:hypothetical protein
MSSRYLYQKPDRLTNYRSLSTNGKFIDDSTDIAYYLDEKWPDPPLIPIEKLSGQSVIYTKTGQTKV